MSPLAAVITMAGDLTECHIPPVNKFGRDEKAVKLKSRGQIGL